MHDSNRPTLSSAARKGRLLRCALTAALAAVGAATGTHVYAAAACDAPWMHEGGGYTSTLAPGQRSMTYTVTQFSKRDGNNCNGQVHAVMKMSMGGQPMQSESDFGFEIADGKATAAAQKNTGALHGTSGMASFGAALSSQTTGVLSYVGEITSEGQRIAGTRTEGAMSGTPANGGQAVGSMSVPKFVTVTSDKVVGKQEQLPTAVGTIVCWPVTYDRSTQADNAQLMGHMANLSMKSHVVDHFCPATGLVMRQDTTVNGRTITLTVSGVH
ncbi:hypothetical protein [Paraburkholderia ferrariae]|uniref:hypothetical protein n=1 Tax=Paraburkholderia ferrariae TaxID=386056 RepID=UPI000484AB8E|nr:hypothetical protein [Paraburkholderia ferrariae]